MLCKSEDGETLIWTCDNPKAHIQTLRVCVIKGGVVVELWINDDKVVYLPPGDAFSISKFLGVSAVKAMFNGS